MNNLASDPFSKIQQAHAQLRQEKDSGSLPSEDFVEKAEKLLKEIRSAGRIITDIIQRQRLESYALYWGRFIAETSQKYLNTSLLKPGVQVFHEEEFTLRDIYIPLKVKPLDDYENDSQTLEEWVEEKLGLDSQKQSTPLQDQILIIQGESGLGKTGFCQMFVDKIQESESSPYQPILIELQKIKSIEKDWKTTLAKNFPGQELIEKSQGSKRRLFLLDGLDNLATDNHPTQSLESFLKQVVDFCLDSEVRKRGDRVLITSRPSILKQILAQPESEQQILPHLKLVEIQPMDEELQKKWIEEKWQKLVGQDVADKFKEFLDNRQGIKKLAQEPLLLYLLAAMDRDQALEKMPRKIGDEEAMIEIFDRMLNWVIRDKEQLPKWIREEISTGNKEKNENEFKRILAEAGLCAIQSGGIRTTMNLLNARLTNRGNELAKRLIQKTPEKKEFSRTVLANFSHDRASESGGSVEFNHKSFSEFLYTKRLRDGLVDWTKQWNDFVEFGLIDKEEKLNNQKNKLKIERDDREEFVITRDRMDWEIYDLLGFGGLTPDIVKYLKAYLKKDLSELSKEFVKERLERIFKRLKNFYYRWFEGEFINKEYSQTFAQSKMLQLQKSLEAQGLFLGRRQIDVYTGLNVLIILLEIHRQLLDLHGDTLNTKDIPTFYPCGKPLPHCTDGCKPQSSPTATEAEGEFTPSRILRLISYSSWLGLEVFVKTVGPFLEGINLRGADLRGAELYGVNLNHAYLSGATLNGINLSGAKLNQSFLGSVQLCRANLSQTELNGAFLGNADLSGAFLGNASLKNAVLTGVNLRTALLVNADLTGTYFGDADLSDANLRNANLENANLSCVNLQDVNLRGANLTNAKLMSADLKGANLKYADLTSADLRGANLKEANLKGADLTDAIVTWENLKDAVIDKTTKGIEKLLYQKGNESENSE